MAEQRAKKSVVKTLVIATTVAIVMYAAIMLIVVNLSLNSGMKDYFKNYIENNISVIDSEMNATVDECYNVCRWYQERLQTLYDGSDMAKTRKLFNSQAERGLNYFQVNDVCFFGSDGEDIIDQRYGNIEQPTLVQKAMGGQESHGIIVREGQIQAIATLPVRNNRGIIVGVAAVKTNISTDEWAIKMANYTSANFAIYDKESRVVTANMPGRKGTPSTNADIVQRAYTGGQAIAINRSVNGQMSTNIYVPVIGMDGSVISVYSMAIPFSSIADISNGIFLMMAIAIAISSLVLIVGVFILLQRLVKRPLTRVAGAIANLSSGEADLTQRLPEEGEDEFALLCADCNSFIVLMQQLIGELTEAQGQLSEIGESLGTNSQQSASATAEIMANIESVRKQSENQSGAVKNTSNTLKNSKVGVDELSSLIDDEAAGITESSAAIEEMLGNIASVTSSVKKMAESFTALNKSVDEGSQKLLSVDKKVSQIAEQSKTLSQANQMIAQIASETNLLAMNAAIEAAHAGDAGKGFSVVADEIRKLAETSSKQSKNINVELKGITLSINDVVTLSQDSQTTFSLIVDKLSSTSTIIREVDNAMTEQETASRQILEALGDIKTQSMSVKERSGDISRDVESVNKDMDTVSEISDTILGAMDEMATGAAQVGSSAQSVSDLASKTSDSIAVMKRLLEQFKA